jgi:hypothetical protein
MTAVTLNLSLAPQPHKTVSRARAVLPTEKAGIARSTKDFAVAEDIWHRGSLPTTQRVVTLLPRCILDSGH